MTQKQLGDRLTTTEGDIGAIKQEMQRIPILEKTVEKIHVILVKMYDDRQSQQGCRNPLARESGAGQDRIKFKKLEMPVFNGEDPDGWFYRVEHYFQLQLLNEQEKFKSQ
ncbi:gypsy/ty3 element polyprotein [Cucumis melo var. makuwa]|uniref:Gypsy/ty3 element polyprotein n=1 Tax=Cucumis melo var. makuwa TaxID=1194695 RepID=A0A5A7UHF6_CUCMM|nr:gypsy/ty3 element polyprotein [Cucumis melo var. makuwa]